MPSNLRNFVNVLANAHRDNGRLFHFARRHGDSQEYSTMPVTPFVYEFFLYSSLYSVDWAQSVSTGQVINLPFPKTDEKTKQAKFEAYLKGLAEKKPEVLTKAFQPLAQNNLQDSWTTVTPDPNISLKDGEEFFKNLQALQNLINQASSFDLAKRRKVFAIIANCRFFIYKVRNNIFHGSKHPDELWDDNQRKRIGVYYQFLHCLISAFFMLTQDGDIF